MSRTIRPYPQGHRQLSPTMLEKPFSAAASQEQGRPQERVGQRFYDEQLREVERSSHQKPQGHRPAQAPVLEQPLVVPRQKCRWLKFEPQSVLVWKKKREPTAVKHLALRPQRVEPTSEKRVVELVDRHRLQEQHKRHKAKSATSLLAATVESR